MCPLREFFSTAVTLKISQGHQIPNQLFMSQLYIHENLVRIQPLVHMILCRQESVTQTPTGSAPKTICPPPRRWGPNTGSVFAHYTDIYQNAWMLKRLNLLLQENLNIIKCTVNTVSHTTLSVLKLWNHADLATNLHVCVTKLLAEWQTMCYGSTVFSQVTVYQYTELLSYGIQLKPW